jgi:F0F1-type ATP synthase assembly protein I
MSRKYLVRHRPGGRMPILLFLLVVAAIAVGIVEVFNAYPWQSGLLAAGVIGIIVCVVGVVRRSDKAKAQQAQADAEIEKDPTGGPTDVVPPIP